jgi:hypothetical protein
MVDLTEDLESILRKWTKYGDRAVSARGILPLLPFFHVSTVSFFSFLDRLAPSVSMMRRRYLKPFQQTFQIKIMMVHSAEWMLTLSRSFSNPQFPEDIMLACLLMQTMRKTLTLAHRHNILGESRVASTCSNWIAFIGKHRMA